jgi:hypothetical protein
MFCNFDDLCPFKAPLYVNGKKIDFKKYFLNLLTNAERAEWWRLTVNHLKWKYIDAIKSRVQEVIVLVFGRLPKMYWPAQHQEALQMAREHILRTEERVVEFTLEIVTCDHFSSLCFGRDYEIIIEMQEALKKSKGGILKGRAIDHLMLNYNQAKIVIRERKAVNAMVRFSRKWAWEEPEVLKLSSLSTDEIPKTVFSYFTKWSDFIAKDASSRCGIQISGSDITIQHLTVYFAHRGGKGNLGKKRSADHRAKMNQAMDHRAKMRKAKVGKKRSAEIRN